MSIHPIPFGPPPGAPKPLYVMTVRGFSLARMAASATADALAHENLELFNDVIQAEEHLDQLDKELDDEVAHFAVQSTLQQVQEALACMKIVIDLERIGDLLASVASRSRHVQFRLSIDDVSLLVRMASVLEQMLTSAQRAFEERDIQQAIAVFRSDAELDRMRNLIFMRHLDAPVENYSPESIHVLLMAQALERAGDHTKNLAEEVCHTASGRSLRHQIKSDDRPVEQMFLHWLKASNVLETLK
jgi:phosphate transport system protein